MKKEKPEKKHENGFRVYSRPFLGMDLLLSSTFTLRFFLASFFSMEL